MQLSKGKCDWKHSKLRFTAFRNAFLRRSVTRQHREPATQAAAAERKQTAGETRQLRRGSLLGCSPTVQVNGDGMDEGHQTEQRQADVHLKEESRKTLNDRAERPTLVSCFWHGPYAHVKRVSIQEALHHGKAGILHQGEERRQGHDHTVQLPKVARWKPGKRNMRQQREGER